MAKKTVVEPILIRLRSTTMRETTKRALSRIRKTGWTL
jgi:hypothetical protein